MQWAQSHAKARIHYLYPSPNGKGETIANFLADSARVNKDRNTVRMHTSKCNELGQTVKTRFASSQRHLHPQPSPPVRHLGPKPESLRVMSRHTSLEAAGA